MVCQYLNRMKFDFRHLPPTAQGMLLGYVAWTGIAAVAWVLYMLIPIGYEAAEFILLFFGLPCSLLVNFLEPGTTVAMQLLLLSVCGYIQWPVIGILIIKLKKPKPVHKKTSPPQTTERKIKMGYSQQRYKILKQKYAAQGNQAYYLELFGNYLAEREGYKQLDGMEAIYFYLVHKFHWMPKEVRSMSFDDIRFVLSEEMVDWTAPPESRIE